MNRICVLSVYVENLSEARQFYIDTLGFEVTAEYGDCLLQLKSEGLTLVLEQVEGDYPGRPCVIPAVEVDNLEEEIARLKQAGVTFIQDQPQDFPAGQFIACRDGSGNIFELLQFS